MTRILFWNVENFGINKIENPSTESTPGHGGNSDAVASADRYQVMKTILREANPDIIVIIEVNTGDGGRLASQTGGFLACYNLLQHLRTPPVVAGPPPPPVEWRLVPPVRVGGGRKAETVGVFYRSAPAGGVGIIRHFTGPNWWIGESTQPLGGARPTRYLAADGNVHKQAILDELLVPPGVPVRTVPAHSIHNIGTAENVLAARTVFSRHGSNASVGYGDLRQPYMVTFAEQDGMNVRNLTLFALHLPPNDEDASIGIEMLRHIAEIVEAEGPQGAPNEVRVLCGDFNVNLLEPNGHDSQPYAYLQQSGYRVLLAPTAALPAEGWHGYFTTHIKPPNRTLDSKFLWSGRGADYSYYPGYGYFGSDPKHSRGKNFFSIDNILVRPAATPTANFTVLNPVVGSPFVKMLPPAGLPSGSIDLRTAFRRPPLGWPPAPYADEYPDVGTSGEDAVASLVGWDNYLRILNLSDHFALCFDV